MDMELEFQNNDKKINVVTIVTPNGITTYKIGQMGGLL